MSACHRSWRAWRRCADPDIDAFVEVEETCPTSYIQAAWRGITDKIVKALGPDLFKVIPFDPATIAATLERWERSEDVLAHAHRGAAGGMADAGTRSRRATPTTCPSR
jgi:hypothetical protein